MRLTIGIIVSLVVACSLLGAGRKHNGGEWPPAKPRPLKFVIPAGWPKPPVNIFANNPLTEEGFQLGRKLFYDGQLSRDGNFPCASCHQQYAAFANYDHDFSHGINNNFTIRNAPALFNLAWMKQLHWDGAINHIEVQPLAPISNPVEMGEEINHVLEKLRKDTAYPRMFKAAFGTPEINTERMMKALTQFVGSILSYNSKYDKVKRGEARFTFSEENGYTIYKKNCAACHPEPLFTDNSFRNNGLPLSSFRPDYGYVKTTGNPQDSFKFKVPSLRNVAITGPYMHDGRFPSITQVIEHYRSGIDIKQTGLDSALRKPINLTPFEKNSLTYFLYTLTDSLLIKDPRYATPNGLTVFNIHPH
ncbi:MAG: cytochrome c peroxidase [Ferruginibacter sp.]